MKRVFTFNRYRYAMANTAEGQQRVLILGGKDGLLGQALAEACSNTGYEIHTTGRGDIDFSGSQDISNLLERIRPCLLFNAVAYTQVDQAEDDQEAAYDLNRFMPAMLGRVIKERPECLLVHYSTDFVFDGRKREPYTVEDAPAPLSVYGKSKLAGEQALLQLGLENLCIIRTAWLFGPRKKNFVRTILGLCETRNSINVVDDQFGSPTYVPDLAANSLKLVHSGGRGIFHITNSGRASWAELASEAIRLTQRECVVHPVPTREYPTKAVRPAYSVLDLSRFTECTGITPRPWPQALADYIFSEFPTE